MLSFITHPVVYASCVLAAVLASFIAGNNIDGALQVSARSSRNPRDTGWSPYYSRFASATTSPERPYIGGVPHHLGVWHLSRSCIACMMRGVTDQGAGAMADGLETYTYECAASSDGRSLRARSRCRILLASPSS